MPVIVSGIYLEFVSRFKENFDWDTYLNIYNLFFIFYLGKSSLKVAKGGESHSHFVHLFAFYVALLLKV